MAWLPVLFIMGALLSWQTPIPPEAREEIILFEVIFQDGSDLYTISPDGENLTQLTDVAGREWPGIISPDGTQIAFVGDFGIPDPRRFRKLIYLMPTNGGEPIALTDRVSYYAEPAWSPDGTNLAFEAWSKNGSSELYLLNLESGRIEQLTKPGGIDGVPVWSPDGNYLAFISRRNHRTGIYVLSLTTRLVTKLPLVELSPEFISGWSLDGVTLLLTGTIDNNRDLFTYNLETGEIIRLTENEAMDGYGRWSPDESAIAFISDRDGDWDLYVMPARGGDAIRLTSREDFPNTTPYHSVSLGDWGFIDG